MLVKVTLPSLPLSCTPRRKFSLATCGSYIEYCPSAVQCQRYTAAPASGPPPLATSSSVISILVGTPSAVPPASPKLVVMSLRTTPLSASTLGPFVPSPG
jgi:hypothetical protein